MLKTEQINQKVFATKHVVMMGMFIALSFVGSFIKIPSPFGTVALDSAPAFIATILLGPFFGSVIAFAGHLLTSLNVGFPLSLPIHLLVALEMAFAVSIVGIIYKKGFFIFALIIGVLINGVMMPASFILIPSFGLPFFTLMVLPLIVGSAINIGIAGVLVKMLKGRIPL